MSLFYYGNKYKKMLFYAARLEVTSLICIYISPWKTLRSEIYHSS